MIDGSCEKKRQVSQSVNRSTDLNRSTNHKSDSLVPARSKCVRPWLKVEAASDRSTRESTDPPIRPPSPGDAMQPPPAAIPPLCARVCCFIGTASFNPPQPQSHSSDDLTDTHPNSHQPPTKPIQTGGQFCLAQQEQEEARSRQLNQPCSALLAAGRFRRRQTQGARHHGRRSGRRRWPSGGS